MFTKLNVLLVRGHRFVIILCTYVVWWSEFLATDREVWVRFPVLPRFLRSGVAGTAVTVSLQEDLRVFL
jgi:hypothetical protein